MQLRSIYLPNRFFIVVSIIIGCFLLGIALQGLFWIGILLFSVFLIGIVIDLFQLFRAGSIDGRRTTLTRWSNGDHNQVELNLENKYPFKIWLKVIDEIPHQFQKRDLEWKLTLEETKVKTIPYALRPVKRGVYHFGALNIYVTSALGIVQRRFRFGEGVEIAVYPSFLELKKYELAAISNRLKDHGLKKLRRIGHSMEFEQIKKYVSGDDPRSLNWKASARMNDLMINQFQDERSQQVYSLIDKGRLMRMPFNGMSLLDYSINASLVISSIAIKKGDKAGLISFSNKLSTMVAADRSRSQMQKIMQVLYHQKTKYQESNFELLSSYIVRKIQQRSLLLLFTNFESLSNMERRLSYFKILAKRHLLIVIFFKNTGIDKLVESNPENIRSVYDQTIAEELRFSKIRIVKELKRYGIGAMLTTPEALTIKTINKYLEIKRRGLL